MATRVDVDDAQAARSGFQCHAAFRSIILIRRVKFSVQFFHKLCIMPFTTMPNPTTNSGIRDNHTRGVVADFLKAKVQTGSRLSVVSAYFTIYGSEELRVGN